MKCVVSGDCWTSSSLAPQFAQTFASRSFLAPQVRHALKSIVFATTRPSITMRNVFISLSSPYSSNTDVVGKHLLQSHCSLRAPSDPQFRLKVNCDRAGRVNS